MKSLPRHARSSDATLEKLLNQILAEVRANKPISTPTISATATANGTKLDAVDQSLPLRRIRLCVEGDSDWFTEVAMTKPYKLDADGKKVYPDPFPEGI
jgi:hypothetical protein